MTLEEFQATRRQVADVQEATGYDLGACGPLPGYVYDDKCYLIGPDRDGNFVLEWIGDQMVGPLGDMESALYDCLELQGLV